MFEKIYLVLGVFLCGMFAYASFTGWDVFGYHHQTVQYPGYHGGGPGGHYFIFHK